MIVSTCRCGLLLVSGRRAGYRLIAIRACCCRCRTTITSRDDRSQPLDGHLVSSQIYGTTRQQAAQRPDGSARPGFTRRSAYSSRILSTGIFSTGIFRIGALRTDPHHTGPLHTGPHHTGLGVLAIVFPQVTLL